MSVPPRTEKPVYTVTLVRSSDEANRAALHIFTLSPATPYLYRYDQHPFTAATTYPESGSFRAKKAPTDHISVKGRGLLLDFNQVWGDETTISFYRVSVPLQIFNFPRGQVFAHVCLNQGIVIGIQRHTLLYRQAAGMVRYGRQQPDRRVETSQGKEQHPAVGMSQVLFADTPRLL